MEKKIRKIERRKSQRLNSLLPIKYKNKRNGPFLQALACQDIGGRGIRIVLPHEVKMNDRMQVLLYLRDMPNPIKTICRVVWCKRNKYGKFIAGLEFLKIKRPEHFMEFLCEKIIESSL